jgi:hypothetical protein
MDENKNSDEVKLLVEQTSKEERKESDLRYAVKLVEVIVFGAVALVLVAVATALIALVVTKI